MESFNRQVAEKLKACTQESKKTAEDLFDRAKESGIEKELFVCVYLQHVDTMTNLIISEHYRAQNISDN